MSESEPANRTTITLAEVSAAYRHLRRLETALAVHGVSVFQVALLAAIADAPGARFEEIARTLGLSPAVMSGGVDRLEKRGLVVRAPWRSADGPADHRRVNVELTDQGRDLLASLAMIEVEQ